jgi:branched-chain amino acid transport system permease protein
MEILQNRKIRTVLNIILLAALFTVVQLLISGQVISTYYQINLSLIMINIILAVSLNLINGITGSFPSAMPASCR